MGELVRGGVGIRVSCANGGGEGNRMRERGSGGAKGRREEGEDQATRVGFIR